MGCGGCSNRTLLNQKHAWPFRPVTFRGSSVPASGTAHQNMNGMAEGTLPFHGAIVPSMACRGGGMETEPCPLTADGTRTRSTAGRTKTYMVGLEPQQGPLGVVYKVCFTPVPPPSPFAACIFRYGRSSGRRNTSSLRGGTQIGETRRRVRTDIGPRIHVPTGTTQSVLSGKNAPCSLFFHSGETNLGGVLTIQHRQPS